jgi:hypothetical protein
MHPEVIGEIESEITWTMCFQGQDRRGKTVRLCGCGAQQEGHPEQRAGTPEDDRDGVPPV